MTAFVNTIQKFHPLMGFLKTLTTNDLNSSQGKAVLGRLSRTQRLAVTELITNVVFCKMELSNFEMERLIKYEKQLRKIVLLGKNITNNVLANHQMAVRTVLRVVVDSMDKHKLDIHKENTQIEEENEEETDDIQCCVNGDLTSHESNDIS